jgi:hypothetical protein
MKCGFTSPGARASSPVTMGQVWENATPQSFLAICKVMRPPVAFAMHAGCRQRRTLVVSSDDGGGPIIIPHKRPPNAPKRPQVADRRCNKILMMCSACWIHTLLGMMALQSSSYVFPNPLFVPPPPPHLRPKNLLVSARSPRGSSVTT